MDSSEDEIVTSETEDQMSSPPSSKSPSSSARKPRKQYTISKQRENWTDEEHNKFLEALKLYDRDWKKIEKFIGTKSVIQIRSHAQKYFQKVKKNNTGERVPPPRQKRKLNQSSPPSTPPAKSKDVSTIPWTITSENITSSAPLSNPSNFMNWMSSNGLLPQNNSPNAGQQQEYLTQARNFFLQASELSQHAINININTTEKSPNYAKIYHFLGSLIETENSNVLDLYSELNPEDQEVIQLMIQNINANLSNPSFKEQQSFLNRHYMTLLQRYSERKNTTTN